MYSLVFRQFGPINTGLHSGAWGRGLIKCRFQDGKYTKFIAEKTRVKVMAEVCTNSGDVIVKLQGGTVQQIEQARVAVEDIVAQQKAAKAAAVNPAAASAAAAAKSSPTSGSSTANGTDGTAADVTHLGFGC